MTIILSDKLLEETTNSVQSAKLLASTAYTKNFMKIYKINYDLPLAAPASIAKKERIPVPQP